MWELRSISRRQADTEKTHGNGTSVSEHSSLAAKLLSGVGLIVYRLLGMQMGGAVVSLVWPVFVLVLRGGKERIISIFRVLSLALK